MSSDNLKVDAEFKALIPPLTDEERAGLEDSLKAEGCRDALVAWQQENVLLDGHNRLAICRKHDISYDVTYVELDDRNAAVNWIINNQLHRRNLTPEQASYLRGLRYNREKGTLGGDRRSSAQNENVVGERTSERLAREYKTGHAVIVRDGRFAAAVDKLAEVHGPDIKQQILNRDTHITKKAVVAAAEEETPEQQKAVLADPSKAKPKPNPASAPESRTDTRKHLSSKERAEQIRPLAEQGYRADQIAGELGIGPEQVQKIAGQHGIELWGTAKGKTRKIDTARVVGETVTSVEGLAIGLDLVGNDALASLGKAQCAELSERLAEALKPLNRLRKQLTEASK